MKKSRLIAIILCLAMILTSVNWPERKAEAASTEYVDGVWTYILSVDDQGDSYATITKYAGSATELAVPGTLGGYEVRRIGDNVCNNNKIITSVTFADSIISIGHWTFQNCSKLASVMLPVSIQSMGRWCFSGTSITQITIPKTLTSAYTSFEGCSKLTDVYFEQGTKGIAGSLFCGVPNLKNIHWVDTISWIGDDAFSNSGTEGELVIPDTVEHIGHRSFQNCNGVTSIKISANLQDMGRWCFSGTSITQITIPKTLTSAYTSFEGCSKLTDVYFEQGTKGIAGSLFCDVPNLKNIHWVDTISWIGDDAFSNSGIEGELVIPDTVEHIGHRSFQNCNGVTSIKISANLQDMGRWCFSGTSITQITIPKTLTSAYTSFEGCSKLTDVYFERGTTGVVGSLFYGVPNLKNIHWINTISSIGENAFASTALEGELVIPDTITSIERWAFENCKGVTSLKLSANIQSMKQHCFSETSISKVTIPKSLTSADAPFANCSKLIEADFEVGCTQVVGGLFYGCTNLKNVILSDRTTSIGNSAFENCSALGSIGLPLAVQTLGNYAFKGCTGLKKIYMKKKITSIGRECFNDCPNLVKVCPKYSSTTETMINADQYVEFSDETCPEDMTYALDRAGTSYVQNGQSASGYLMLNLDYAVSEKKQSALTDINIVIKLPSSSILNDLKMDGATLTEKQYAITANTIITIPVSRMKGNVRISTTTDGDGMIYSYAKLTYKDDGQSRSEMIGALSEVGNYLTLISKSEVAYEQRDTSTTLEVQGYGVPNQTVEIYANDEFVDEVTISKLGYYTANISLMNPEEYKKYEIRVVSKDKSGKEKKCIKEVRTIQSSPILVSAKLYIEAHDYAGGNETFDLLQQDGSIKYITFQMNKPYQFTMKYTHPEKIQKVYVISKRGGTKYRLQAEWNKEKQEYITQGYFNGDRNYVPGIISIEYVGVEPDKKCAEDGSTALTDKEKQDIPDNWRQGDAEEIQDPEYDYSSSIILQNGDEILYNYKKMTFSDYADELLDEMEESTPQTVPSTVNKLANKKAGEVEDIEILKTIKSTTDFSVDTVKTLKSLGFKEYLRSGNTDEAVLGELKAEATLIKSEFSGDLITNYLFDLDTSNKEKEPVILKYVIKKADSTVNKNLMEMIGFDSTAQGFTSTMASGIVDAEVGTLNYAQSYFDIMSDPSLTEAQRTAKLNQLRSMQDIIGEKVFYTYLAAVLGMLAVSTAGVGVGIALGILSKTITSVVIPMVESGDFDRFLDGKLSLQDMLIRWIIDPSGYVYEGVTSNRLAGVKTTLYYRESLESDKITVWNATEYNQQNPVYTDVNGCYAWDVPEGYWQVKYEMDGYETATSEWMPVPPIQTDVNIKMKPNTAAVVTGGAICQSYADVSFSQYLDPESVASLVVKDDEGNNISYTLSYDNSQTDADGVVYANQYRLLFDHPLVVGSEAKISGFDKLINSGGVSMDTQTISCLVEEDKDIIDGSHTLKPTEGSGYEIDADGLITGLQYKSNTVTDIKANFTNSAVIIKDSTGKELANTDTVGTGATISLMDGETVADTCTVVLVGDLDGNGKVGAQDISKIARYRLSKEVLTDAQIAACDVNGDGKVGTPDVSMLSRYRLGKGTIPSQTE